MTGYARRQWLGRAGLAGAGAAIVAAAGPPRPAQAASSTPAGVNVRDYGALGDGTTDDTLAVQRAINAAGGDLVYFPSGVYMLNKVAITKPADLMLGVGATLRHLPSLLDDYMLGFASDFLRIRGGVLDGNRARQAGRTTLIAGAVQRGKTVLVDGVQFVSSVKAAIYVRDFGGQVSVTSCSFADQAEHDGIPSHSTAIVVVVNAEPGARGHLSFNFNRASGTATPALAGGAPGGVFFAPGLGSGSGSGATFEAIGNWFWGYGQNLAGNTISPLHTYPAASGVRMVGNYFEASGCAAISAKSITNFVCSGNVVCDGAIGDNNTPAEGAITYAPSYLANSISNPRAVISGNVISNPGGTSARPSNGIAVFGSATSVARSVVVADNIIDGCGTAVTATYATDLTVAGNVITGRDTTPLATSGAIRIDNSSGRISIAGNKVSNRVNHAIMLSAGMQNAQLLITGNEIMQDAPGYYGIMVAGVQSVTLTGNSFSGGSYAYTARGYGAQHLKRLHTDASNAFALTRAPVFVWSEIDAVTGEVASVNTPKGVVPPGEVGVRYTQRNGGPGSTLWLSTGTTRDAWTALS